MGFKPQTVVFGNSGIGFTSSALVLDDSTSAKAPGNGSPGLDPPRAEIDADVLAWRGILAREMAFYLSANVPFVGGRAIRGYFEQSTDSGTMVVVETKVPETPAADGFPDRPGFSVRIECLDPTARGLAGMVPTLISASVEVPDGPADLPIDNGTVSLLRGKGLRLTASLMRDPVSAPGEFRVAVAATAQGDEGLISVRSNSDLDPAKFFNVAAAVSTALIADGKANAQSKLSPLQRQEPRSRASSRTIPARPPRRRNRERRTRTADRRQDPDAARLHSPGAGRAAWSRRALRQHEARHADADPRARACRQVDPAASGAAMFDLDFDHAELEVEDPGAWDVTGMERLFDVLASRSGRGSGWVEVDLQFKMNLGPIEVTDLTLRASFDNGPSPVLSLRGMGARLHVRGARG